MFRTCIVDTSSNLVVNIVEYETLQTGIPPGLDDSLLCVQNEKNNIGDAYTNGVFISKPHPPTPLPIL